MGPKEILLVVEYLGLQSHLYCMKVDLVLLGFGLVGLVYRGKGSLGRK